MEQFTQRRISDVSFILNKNLDVMEGNRSFLKLFDVTDPHINLSKFMNEADCKNFKFFLDNFDTTADAFLNPYFIANILSNKRKIEAGDISFKSCLFYVEKKTAENSENLFNIDVKELSYSKVLLDKALLESREYTALLQNFDAYYFVFDGEKFILKNTKDANILFQGNSEEFKGYFANNFNLCLTPTSDSTLQFNTMINDCKSFTANKIYNFLQNDKKLISVHTVKTSTRNRSSIVASISHGKERGLVENVYSETKDGLTGLYNKKAITELITKKVNEAKNPLSLIIMDVDKFKDFNDNYGHAFGDKVLVAVSQCIKEAINGIGIAGRIGGDEFIIALNKTEEDDIRNVLRNIRTGIQWSITAADPASVVTSSMGIARFPLNADNYDELFKIADKSLYIAKNKGRNCYIIYKPELHDVVIKNDEKNATVESVSDRLQNSSETEYEILELLKNCDKNKIQAVVEKLVDYMQMNKVTIYDSEFKIIAESEKLTQKNQKPLGNIREEYLKNPKNYFKYFNRHNFLHLDNTNVLDTLDRNMHDMYHGNEISSTLEIKSENCLVCFDLYRPARTFPKEKIIFALLAARLISENI